MIWNEKGFCENIFACTATVNPQHLPWIFRRIKLGKQSYGEFVVVVDPFIDPRIRDALAEAGWAEAVPLTDRGKN
ncbi:MAG: hypothetical protein ACOVOV_01250 [Dolichospermum sp.]